MKEKITYGSTIHSDDTVTRRTRFDCNSLKEFKSFWQNRLTHTSNNENASWTANIELLSIERKDYVTSEEYFALHIDDIIVALEWFEGEEE